MLRVFVRIILKLKYLVDDHIYTPLQMCISYTHDS